MRFPLKNKAIGGYRFKEDTFYHTNHLGTDWRANFEPLYAPTDGVVESTPYGTQGGQWLHFRDDTGNLHRFGHLSEIKKTGKVKEGDVIAITGNSGKYTTAPHLHEDITRAGEELDIYDLRKFIDPEEYYNQKPMKKYYCKSQLRNELKKIWEDFDHTSGSSQEKMAEKLDDFIDELEEATENVVSLAQDKKQLILDQAEINKAHDRELEEIKKYLSKKYNDELFKKDKIIKTQKENLKTAITVESSWSKILELITTKLTK